MEAEVVMQLLEKVNDKQRTAALRYLSHNNKKLRIPGFSLMEKAPIKLVANTARTNSNFRRALYESIAMVVLDGSKVDHSKSIDDLKNEFPQTKWLGLAAYLLMMGEEKHTEDALKLITDDINGVEAKETVQNAAIRPEPKLDKKEEKFREKYLKAKNENAELVAELAKHKELLQNAAATIEKLKESQQELESKCAGYLAEIDALNDRNSRLTQQLEEATEKTKELQTAQTSKVDIRVLAPNCKDILEGYRETIPMAFDMVLSSDMENVIDKYDEIWVLVDVVPFGTLRVLRKWKKLADQKVFIFQTVGDLVTHVDNVVQTDGRR